MQQIDAKGGKLAEDGLYDRLRGIAGRDEPERVQPACNVVLTCTGKCTSVQLLDLKYICSACST